MDQSRVESHRSRGHASGSPSGSGFRRPSPRAGSILPAILVISVIAALMALGLMTRAIRATRTGDWSRDHAVARLLADSAMEELRIQLERGANLAGDPTCQALRTAPADKNAPPFPLPLLRPSLLASDVASRRDELGGTVALSGSAEQAGAHAWISRLLPLSSDPRERAGIVTLEVRVQLKDQSTPVAERVRAEWAFSVVRVDLAGPRFPGPTGAFSLYIGKSEESTLPNFAGKKRRSGPAVFLPSDADALTRVDGRYVTLLSAMTRSAPDGLARLPRPIDEAFQKSLALVSPEGLAARAQFVTGTDSQLTDFLSRRFHEAPDRGIEGLIYNASPDPIRIEFSTHPFRGRALIAAAGPIDVHDVVLADPETDSLTVVSPRRIVVWGRKVMASLVCTGPEAEGVFFSRRAQVLGPVITSRFPQGPGLSGVELGQCQVGANPGCRTGPGSARDETYVTIFSPAPVTLEHLRD